MRAELHTEPLTLIGKMDIGRIPPRTQEKTANPSRSVQEIEPDRYYTGLSKVVVNPVTSSIDSDIKPENIKVGVEILGVVGTYEQGYFPSAENSSLVFEDSDRPVSVEESELILQ